MNSSNAQNKQRELIKFVGIFALTFAFVAIVSVLYMKLGLPTKSNGGGYFPESWASIWEARHEIILRSLIAGISLSVVALARSMMRRPHN
jgi:hypothetical protein